MTLLRNAVMLALLTMGTVGAPVSAAAAPDTLPPSGIAGMTDAQLSPDFWIARLTDADRVIIDANGVDALNRKVMRLDPSMHDIRHLPATLTGDQVTGWIRKLSSRPTKPLFDEQGKPVAADTIDALLANDAIDAVPARVTPRYGMAVNRAPLRGHATDLRVFTRIGDTDIDRFQESTLFPGDPVVVIHASRDGKWVFVVSERYAAWTPASDIAYATDAAMVFSHADAMPYRVVTGARALTVHSPEAGALSGLSLDMGTRAPLDTTVPADEPVNGQHPYTSWVLSLPVRDSAGALAFHPALLPRAADTAADYLPLTRANIVRQAFRFLGERYGWGHAYNGRDCSGFVSDVYRSMGVQMPRNTGDQGESPGLDHTDFTAKDDHDSRVKAVKALDAGDLVYMPGHVMMVIGKIDGEPYVIHDVGSVSFKKTDGTLRAVKLNEVAVTPLLPLMSTESTSFVDRMTSIVRIH